MGFYRCGGGENILPGNTVAITDAGYKVANKDGNCYNLFNSNTQVRQCILGNNITNMVRMFAGCTNLKAVFSTRSETFDSTCYLP